MDCTENVFVVNGKNEIRNFWKKVMLVQYSETYKLEKSDTIFMLYFNMIHNINDL